MNNITEYARIQDLALMSGAKIVGGCSGQVAVSNTLTKQQFTLSDWDYILITVMPEYNSYYNDITPGANGIIYRGVSTYTVVLNLEFAVSSDLNYITINSFNSQGIKGYMITAFKNP